MQRLYIVTEYLRVKESWGAIKALCRSTSRPRERSRDCIGKHLKNIRAAVHRYTGGLLPVFHYIFEDLIQESVLISEVARGRLVQFKLKSRARVPRVKSPAHAGCADNRSGRAALVPPHILLHNLKER